MRAPLIPLRLRLPNPPAVFLGRRAESAWLRTSIRKSPVSVVWGSGGAGKSALVLQTIHESFADRISRTLFVALRPAGSVAESLSSSIVAALADAEHIRVDGSGLADDPEALVAVAIDLAESGGWWVVLDDLHHAHPSEVGDLLGNLARYARESRWIATSRAEPRREELAGHVLALGSMPDAALRSLAKRLLPKGTRVALQEAVASAKGSPWRLKQCLAAGPLGPETSWDALLAVLPEAAAEFLRVLSLLDVAISRESLAAIGARVPERELAVLEQRGLVERTTAGFRLHDVVRALLAGTKAEAQRAERAASGLIGLADPVAALEGARLLLGMGRADDVLAFVESRGEELLAAGQAARLWRVIGPAADPRLAAIRLRCAVELGDPAALARVPEPARPSVKERFLWARALLMRGHEEEAVEAAARARVEAAKAGDVATEAEAGMLRTRVLTNLGRADVALEELQSMRVTGAEDAARRDMRIAMCRVSRGELADAVRSADALRARLPSLPPSSREEVGYGVAVVYHRAGRLREAAEVFDGVLANERGEARALYFWRQSLFLRAVVALQRGALKEGGDALARLQPLWGRSPALRLSASVAESIRRTAAGELEGLEESLEEAVREGTGIVRYAASVQLELLRMLLGEEPANEDARGLGLLDLFRMRRRVRFGKLPPGSLPGPDEVTHPEHQDAAAIVAAESELLAGRGDEALVRIATAIRGAREHGYFLGEVAACQLRCEALLTLDRVKELARAAEELAAHATAMPSPRFAREARFFLAVSRDDADPAELEDLGASLHVAPVAARRAQALLGGEPRLDSLDRQVLEAFRRRTGWREPVALGPRAPGAPWQPGWGIDEARRRIWRSGAAPVAFGDRPLLWKIVLAIADRNGAASKEDLVREVWAEEEYHPLRHDNRLQLAIRKLRRAIEADPSRPALLVTTESGYAFAGGARRL